MNGNRGILCPRCRRLVSDYVETCPNCGLSKPGSGFHRLGEAMNRKGVLVNAIIFANIALFVAAHLLSFFMQSRYSIGGGLSFLSPSSEALNGLGWTHRGLAFGEGWWSLVTAAFLHGGPLHILFSMLWIRDLAPLAEDLFNPLWMFFLFIVSGVAGNLLHVFFSPAPVVGASGAIFGLMGAIVLFGRTQGGYFLQRTSRQLGMWALILIPLGFLMPGISNLAHIGGFGAGALFGLLYPKIRKDLGTPAAIGATAVCGVSLILMLLRLFQMLAG